MVLQNQAHLTAVYSLGTMKPKKTVKLWNSKEQLGKVYFTAVCCLGTIKLRNNDAQELSSLCTVRNSWANLKLFSACFCLVNHLINCLSDPLKSISVAMFYGVYTK